MRPFWSRFVRHALLTGILLAVVGYVLGRAFLMTHRIYGGSAYDPENERVLWQTPLVMATLGILMTGSMDLLTGFLRRRVPVQVQTSSGPETGA
jgi:hypothetical protein